MDAIRLMKSPGAQQESSEEIERLLSCPICLDVYSKPVVILPCQHNLCRKCAHDMFTSRGTPMGSGGRFRCPTCRYEVLLDRHGVYGLQRNLLVENIVDMYQTSQNVKPTVNYKPNEEVILCRDHPEEKVNIYCVTCQKPTCSLCKIFGTCADCEVATLPEMHATLKVELTDSIAKLVSSNDQLEAAISQTEEIAKVTETNGNSVKSNVNAAFDKLKEILESRREMMISMVSKELKKKKEYSDKVNSELKTQQNSSGEIMDGALNLVEVRNPAVFLEQARTMINKIEESLEVEYDHDTCMDLKDMSKFEIDFRQEEELLNQINFLSMKDNRQQSVTTAEEAPTTSSNVENNTTTLRPWEVDNGEESEEEEEEEDEQDEAESSEDEAEDEATPTTNQLPAASTSTETSDESETDEDSPYVTASSRSSRFPWRASGTATPLTTASLRNQYRAPSPESSSLTRSSNNGRVWFDSDNDTGTEEAPAASSSSSAPRPQKSSLRIKIDPPKSFTWTRPSYKPKRPVRFANLLPLSDSDNDPDNYSTSRRGRLAVTSRYGREREGDSSRSGATLGSDLPSNRALDSMLDPGVSTRSDSDGSSEHDPSQSSRRKKSSRDYCTHKRRTWSHLLERKKDQ